jgi:dihydrofolate reductase
MRNVVLYQLLSFDGVAEEPGDWMFDDGREIFDNLGAVIANQDAVLMGRGTFDYWVDFWPASDLEPFASFINGTEKHVFSSRPVPDRWQNMIDVAGPAVDHVRTLKDSTGGDIGIHGSIALSQSLWHAGLIDELRLVVAPTIAGRGRRLFDGSADLSRLTLLHNTSTSAGTLLLHYRVLASKADS